MAGYPKIWTRIRHRPWFRKLKAVQKCIWYEMILTAKEQTDDGWVCFPNVTTMAAQVGCSRESVEDWLWRECGHDAPRTGDERGTNGGRTGDERGTNAAPTGEQRVSNLEKSKFVLRFYLTEYNESQAVKSFADLKKRSLKGREGKGTEGKGIILSGKPDSNQKIPDGEYGDRCEWLVTAINRVLGIKADYGQVGKILQKAETLGHAVIAVERVKVWIKSMGTKKEFMGAVFKELQGFQGWSDADLLAVKSENRRFEDMSAQKHGSQIGNILKRIT